MNEASMHDQNSFITLTYDEEHHEPNLNYAHFQTFMRKLRRRSNRVRFFAVGEYGEKNKRPHWHAILFGISFRADYAMPGETWGNHELEKLWGQGNVCIGQVNWTTAGYVAAYCITKRNGKPQELALARVNLATGEIYSVAPEIQRMSLKPGIGESWIKKYKSEVYLARDGIVKPGGKTISPPRYYDKVIKKENEKLIEQKKNTRIKQAKERAKDNTKTRLETKEKIAIAEQKRKQREL